MNRRGFCKRAALGVAGGGGLASTIASGSGRDDLAYVTTRGHFDLEAEYQFWDGNGFYEETLADGHSKYDYDTVGDIPWGADELVVWLHGWGNDREDGLEHFRVGKEQLRANGYDGSFVGYSYDVTVDPWQFWTAARFWAHLDVARRNGPKLANFIHDFARTNPWATIHVVGASMGNQVIFNAMEVLDRVSTTVDTVCSMAAAADNEVVAMDNQYGPALERNAAEFHNFYNRQDLVLTFGYSIAEWDAALGREGVEGTPPDNCTEYDVTGEVPFHSKYHTEAGIAHRIADTVNSYQ